MDLDVKVSQVFFVGHGADTRNAARRRHQLCHGSMELHHRGSLRFSHQPLSFLDDSFWQRHPGRWVYEVNRRKRALQ